MKRLCEATLAEYDGPATRPTYNRVSVTARIVHLGIGAFHRAHQAVYIDDCLAIDPSWGIVGASLRRGDTADALQPQDCLYTLAVRDGNRTDTRIIGAIKEILHAPPGNNAVVDRIASANTQIVTLTVTEKAYCRNPATGDLDLQNSDIAADLNLPDGARSVPGLLTRALARRRHLGLPPISIVSCDNLPANGTSLARVIDQFAELTDPALAVWIRDNVAFPSTMVDRIVPATTDADRAAISELTGYEDAWPVITEPFCQWVIEDRFAAGRPPLDEVGVVLTDNVAPFEAMKLQLLNASHSALAYLGIAAGYETVADAVGDPVLAAFVLQMMHEEILPTLTVPDIDLETYIQSLMARYANVALKHRTIQIAMDGSQKIPQRLLGTISARRSSGNADDRLCLTVAAWLRHLYMALADGKHSAIDDPMADLFRATAEKTLPDVNAFGNAILDLKSVFGADLSADQTFRNAVLKHLTLLLKDGVHSAVKATLRS
ncbi:MAG: mannitol dehydrogenase family protein [Pseudomonadota bacterium]